METKTFGPFLKYVAGFEMRLSDTMNTLIERLRIGASDDVVGDPISTWMKRRADLVHAHSSGYKPGIVVRATAALLSATEELLDIAKSSTKVETIEFEVAYNSLKAQLLSMVEENGLVLKINPTVDINSENKENYVPNSVRPELKRIQEQIQEQIQSLQDAVDYQELKLDEGIAPLREQYESAIRDYQKVKPALDNRAAELDKLLGLAGKKVLAGNYDDYADRERLAANWLRFGALAVMLTAIAPIAISLYEATKSHLATDEALIRLAFSIILSVPAAYMARESTKHRQQQYALRQTALDVGAIDAYIATLPIESQHKIKESIAGKLFAPKSFDHVAKESYPINIQELVTKLVDVAAARRDREELSREGKAKNEAS